MSWCIDDLIYFDWQSEYKFKFKEGNEYYYKGYTYYLPVLNGKSKRIKNKTIVITDAIINGGDIIINDFIVKKYGTTAKPDFMGRIAAGKITGVQGAVNLPFSSPSTTAASTATAIVIAVAAIGTVGAFLTIKKKKIHK